MHAMEYAACNVVYVDRAVGEDRTVRRHEENGQPTWTNLTAESSTSDADKLNVETAVDNLRTLLGTFSEVYVCTTGKACISKLAELNALSLVDFIPTLVLIDVPYDDDLEGSKRNTRTPSPGSGPLISGQGHERRKDLYGPALLHWIASEIQYQSLSKLIVPVAMLSVPRGAPIEADSSGRAVSDFTRGRSVSGGVATLELPINQTKIMSYLDMGAVDVLTCPVPRTRVPGLAIHAYRAHKAVAKETKALSDMKRGRKRSWVGLDDQKPYAYLREAMVSSLMDGICMLGGEESTLPGHMRVLVSLERREAIADAIGTWHFSAHDFTEDELLHGAILMLEHALALPELEQWRISTEGLTGFLVACRAAYNSFVPFHNFRHVIDVLQASFHFLVQIGALPPYPLPDLSESYHGPKSPVASLIRPFDALTLLITAIGHDVGHPGVNNAFLVTLNAPLAQLYNDTSVLESFHCAAYSQILRRHWPAAFHGVEMRKLMISSILATDMGLHFDYMKKLGFLQEKLHEDGGADGWNGRYTEEQRTLACALLIKCADISNVARRYDCASKWTMVLTEEFERQALMEADLGIPTALFATPTRELVELGKFQLGFMNMFAIPLFQGVMDVIPAMKFSVDELLLNKTIWEERVATAQAEATNSADGQGKMDGMFSPRSMSMAAPSDVSNQRKLDGMTPSEARLLNDKLGVSNSSTSLTYLDEDATDSSENAHHSSLSPSNTTDSTINQASGAFPSESSPSTIPNQKIRRSSKPPPSQLQLNSSPCATLEALDADTSYRNGYEANGEPRAASDSTIIQKFSLSADPFLLDQSRPARSQQPRRQRSSDTTEDSTTSARDHGDWASQATSATTSKIPLSPSTRGTSLTSNASVEILPLAQTLVLPGADSNTNINNNKNSSKMDSVPASIPLSVPPSKNGQTAVTSSDDGDEKPGGTVTIKQTMKTLSKRPSRFRLSFWKKKQQQQQQQQQQQHAATAATPGVNRVEPMPDVG